MVTTFENTQHMCHDSNQSVTNGHNIWKYPASEQSDNNNQSVTNGHNIWKYPASAQSDETNHSVTNGYNISSHHRTQGSAVPGSTLITAELAKVDRKFPYRPNIVQGTNTKPSITLTDLANLCSLWQSGKLRVLQHQDATRLSPSSPPH